MPNRLKVLLAEDSDIDAFLFQRAVRETGVALNVQLVRDGQEVLDYLRGADRFADRQQFPMPALIILDVKMPRLTGFDVLSWLKAQPGHSSTPVVMLSGSDERKDVTRAYSMGACTYLVKPHRSEEMSGLVRTLQDYWLRYAKVPESGI
jgi:CheY-like chemotaxis protein